MGTIRYIDDAETVKEALESKRALIFKNSSMCGISRLTLGEFRKFAGEINADITCYIVQVIENRELSQKIAELTGILHQSPQAIYIKDGIPVWNASHMSITYKELNSLIDRFEG